MPLYCSSSDGIRSTEWLSSPIKSWSEDEHIKSELSSGSSFHQVAPVGIPVSIDQGSNRSHAFSPVSESL